MNGRGGKPIKVPTELTSTPQTAATTDPGATVIRKAKIRSTTIRFPGSASMSEISAWLHLKLVSHKPKYFQSPAGKSYPVAPLTAGSVVTGANTTP